MLEFAFWLCVLIIYLFFQIFKIASINLQHIGEQAEAMFGIGYVNEQLILFP